MAQLSSNPWILTPQDRAPSPVIAFWKHPIQHAQFEYIDYTDPSHTVEVWDENLQIVWRAKGRSDLATVRSGRVGWTEGLALPLTDKDNQNNMPTGKLLVYFE